MPEEINISEWELEEQSQGDLKILRFPDFETIQREVRSKKDLALALEKTAQWLFGIGYGVIATKRDKGNDAWLAKCTLP